MNNNQMRQTVKTDRIRKKNLNKIFKELIHNVNRNPQPS